MASPRNIIGPTLRKLRVERGLSQQGLANLLQRAGWDISRGTIARIEGQIRWVADFELVVLSNATKVPIETLLSPSRNGKLGLRLVQELQYPIKE